MKILILSGSLSRSAGGLFYSVSGLAKALLGLGVDVRVIGGADAHFAEDRQQWGEVPLLPFPLRNGYGLHFGALAEIRRQKPDLVLVQGIWSAIALYGRLCVALDVPVIVSPRGMLDKWILARRPGVKKIHAALVERPLMRRAFVHALNEPERAATLSFMPSLAERIFVVPNGIPPAEAPAEGERREGALYLGRLHSKKQVTELIDAWSRLPGTAKQRLTVAGWGDPSYTAAVEQAARAAERVDFAGPLYGEAKSQALKRARFFILPSQSEGLPMAVLEAIQHGCIPVITRECNLPELFRDGIAMEIARDFHDFEQVMVRALGMPEDEMKRASAAASSYSQRYLWTEIAGKMLEHCQRIVSTGST